MFTPRHTLHWLLPLVGCLLAGPSLPRVAMAAPKSDNTQPGHVKLVLDRKGFSGPVHSVSFSSDGNMLAACGQKEVRIWEVGTGRLLRTLRGDIGPNGYGDCLAVAFSRDNCELVVGIRGRKGQGSLRVYDVRNIAEMKERVGGLPGAVQQLAFSRDGRFLVAACIGKTIVYDWRLRSVAGSVDDRRSTSVVRFPLGEPYLLRRGAAGTQILSVPGLKPLPLGRVPDALMHWVEGRGRLRLPFGGRIEALDFRLERERWLGAGIGKDGGRSKYWAAMWSAASTAPAIIYDKHRHKITAVALSDEGGWAATADERGEIHVWQTETGEQHLVFRPIGRPVYRAAFNARTRQIGFTTEPVAGGEWARNRRGVIDRAFDLDRRAIVEASPDQFPAEATDRGSKLTVTYAGGKYGLRMATRHGQSFDSKLPGGTMPTSFALLSSPRLGSEYPTVVGDLNGRLFSYDPVAAAVRREFLGHRSFVTSVSESADGRLLTTSSTDGTIRLWSLQDYGPLAWLGVRLSQGTVTHVPHGSPAAVAGLRTGDRLLAIDDKTPAELTALGSQAGKLRPGQRVTLKMQRGGRPYETQLVLREQPDLIEPQLSLFLVDETEWVMWTPQGYFDASPGFGELLGWHVNRGPDRSASFYPVHQFHKQFYRPDLVNLVLQTGSADEAIAMASIEAPEPIEPAGSPVTSPVTSPVSAMAGLRKPQSFTSPAPLTTDLRRPQTMQRMEPPRVRILSPRDGMVTKEGNVHVLAEVVSNNQRSIASVRVLVNGRPAGGKGVAVVAGERADPRRASFSRTVNLLPGENQISVLAANGLAGSVPVTVRVNYNAPQIVVNAKPNLHLLSIGISKYKDKNLNLQFAHRDAQVFADAWDSQRGTVYQKIDKTLLIDEQATAQRIRSAMMQLAGQATQRDIVVIFISAHGIRDRQLDYYLATHEVDPNNLPNTGLHFSTVTQLLEVLPCKVLLFVDTCHAAGITGAKAIWKDPLYELTSSEYGAIVFSSSLSREISLEDKKWGHGAFTKAILDTFGTPKSDINGDGFLSLTEMEQSVCDRVQQMTKGGQHPTMKRPSTIHNIPFYCLGKGTPRQPRLASRSGER